jgi:predicted transcriptional regulator
MSNKTKAMSIRLPVDIYENSSKIARRRRVSMNRLVQEGLESLLKQEEGQRLYDAFGQVGADQEESEVEFALPAQREVIGVDES